MDCAVWYCRVWIPQCEIVCASALRRGLAGAIQSCQELVGIPDLVDNEQKIRDLGDRFGHDTARALTGFREEKRPA
jgi:hypothetical protein